MKILNTPVGQFRTWDEGILTRDLEAGKPWDPHLNAVLQETHPGETVLDLGAHIGWYTRYLAEDLECDVLALEPHPETFRMLHHNMAQIGGGHAECWPVAAYDTTTTLHFAPGNDRSDAGTWAFIPTSGHPTMPSPAVPAIALDDYVPFETVITLIKADCQGADLRALTGLQHTIARCRPVIVFEFEEAMAAWHGDTWPDYLQFFAERQYRVTRIDPGHWDYVARPL
jgi:FkbM family methyltransferase